MYEHMNDLESLLADTEQLIDEIVNCNVKKVSTSRVGEKMMLYDVNMKHIHIDRLKKNLQFLYSDRGIGFKLLAKSLGNITYTRIRTLCSKLGIETRKGKNCVTESLRKLRSERARTSNPWSDWTGNDRISRMHSGKKRYKCGWYFNESKQKWVWLRSSWEYAYAKFLNREMKEWDVEVRSYLLSDGRYYRPDFFVFENSNLQCIVEVKSRWNNGALDRIDKFQKFQKEFTSVKSEIVTEEIFEKLGQSQLEILEEWKNVRIMEKAE